MRTSSLPKLETIKLLLILLPLFIILAFLFLKIEYNHFYTALTQEDSWLENLQAFFYFGSCLISVISALRLFTVRVKLEAFVFCVLAIISFMLAMEEISWGQRLFQISTPEYFQKNNIQKEISIHNLKPVQNLLNAGYIVTGLIFSFGWLITGLTDKLPLGDKLHRLLKIFSPRIYLATFFPLLSCIYAYFIAASNKIVLWDYKFQVGGFVQYRDQEPAELLLSLGFFLFNLSAAFKSRSEYLNDRDECAI